MDFETSRLGKRYTRWVKASADNGALDAELAAAAAKAIECLTTVPPESIRVTARNGWVHLAGTVNWGHQRALLEDVTRSLPGVQGIIDCIAIETPRPAVSVVY